jgi:hypothetical protein
MKIRGRWCKIHPFSCVRDKEQRSDEKVIEKERGHSVMNWQRHGRIHVFDRLEDR